MKRTRNDPKTLAYRWEALAWIIARHGQHLTTDEDVAGVTPRLPAATAGATVDYGKLGQHLKGGFNMAAAVVAVSTLEGDTTTVTIPREEQLTHKQAETVSSNMGASLRSPEDMDALWHAPNIWPCYQKQPALLAKALKELADTATRSGLPVFPARKIYSVLSAHASEGALPETAARAETRDRAYAAPPEPWKITARELHLRQGATIAASMKRSDGAAVRRWVAQRVQERWVGASSAASCLGSGVGYENPEQVYETLIGSKTPRKHTNAMVAGTARQEEVISAAIATLEDEGWRVRRLLPEYGEATIADTRNTWDVATLDCALELVNADTGEIRRAVLEVKVPDSVTYNAKWETTTADADGKTVKHATCPPPVAMQIQDQMRLTGYRHGIAAAMKPSWVEARTDGLPSVSVMWLDADPDLQKKLARAKKEMRRCVTNGIPPSQDKAYYGPLARSNVGQPSWTKKLETPNDVVTVNDADAVPFKEMRDIQEREKELKAEKDTVRAQIDGIIGGANTVMHGNEELATYRGRQAIDTEAFLADPRARVYRHPDGDEGGDNEGEIDWPLTLSNNPDVVADTIGSAETRAALRFPRRR